MEKLEDLPPDLLRHAFAVADKDKQLVLCTERGTGHSVVLFSKWGAVGACSKSKAADVEERLVVDPPPTHESTESYSQ